MRWSTWGWGLSFVVHLGLAGAVVAIPVRTAHQATSFMAIANEKKKPKPEEEKKPDPPKPIEAPRHVLHRPKPAPKPAPAPENTPPPPTPTPQVHSTPSAAMAAMGGSTGGGLAIPMGGGGGPEPTGHAAHGGGEKTLKAAAPKPTVVDDCTEEPVKAKQVSAVMPQYTDEARSAGIEGRVRVRVTIDGSGNVTDAQVLGGLGHGLDQAALVAARRWKFKPQTRCGKAEGSTLVISMRFVLGE
jgi:protein TonB